MVLYGNVNKVKMNAMLCVCECVRMCFVYCNYCILCIDNNTSPNSMAQIPMPPCKQTWGPATVAMTTATSTPCTMILIRTIEIGFGYLKYCLCTYGIDTMRQRRFCKKIYRTHVLIVDWFWLFKCFSVNLRKIKI